MPRLLFSFHSEYELILHEQKYRQNAMTNKEKQKKARMVARLREI